MTAPHFKYRGFGLNIGSDIEFPELYPGPGNPEDLRIRELPINDPWFQGLDRDKISYRIDEHQFRLQVPGVGRYTVEGGGLVTASPYPDGDPSAFRMYVLTFAISALLLQRRRFLLHASGIVLDDSVVLFAGESGTGKSTLVHALMKQGHRIFTDDVCAIARDEASGGHLRVHASYPMMKIKADLLQELPQEASAHRIWPDADKYGILFHDRFMPEPMPLKAVVLLAITDDRRGIPPTRIAGVKTFEALSSVTYRRNLIHGIDLQSAHSRLMADIAQATPIYQLLRPAVTDKGAWLTLTVERFLHEWDSASMKQLS